MANLKQSKKRARQDLRKRTVNKRNLSIIKTFIKNFRKLINSGNFDAATKNYSLVVSKIDKGVAKGVYQK